MSNQTCPWCGGKGKIQTRSPAIERDAPWVDCFYCSAHAMQGSGWNEACQRLGVPAAVYCFGCASYNKGCVNAKHGPSTLRVNAAGQTLKNATCIDEIMSRVNEVSTLTVDGVILKKEIGND